MENNPTQTDVSESVAVVTGETDMAVSDLSANTSGLAVNKTKSDVAANKTTSDAVGVATAPDGKADSTEPNPVTGTVTPDVTAVMNQDDQGGLSGH